MAHRPLVAIAAALTTVFTVCGAFALGSPDTQMAEAEKHTEQAIALLTR
jgi:hypothetical protein